ncbi:MAG TPA: sulfotransferase [Terriglobia bacterium]|nr:sulfotransferase [Terriglobia bacterium]
MTNPVVFIVGCPRSGTTLLRRILDAHPQIAVTKETQWFDESWLALWFEQRRGLTPDGNVTPELVAFMLEHPKFSRLKMPRQQFLDLAGNGASVHFSAFVTRIFDHYGQIKGKARVGNKDPVYVRKLSLLHSLWPEARFVHLIRDGRDVSLSVIHWPDKGPISKRTYATSNDDPVSTAALWWECNVRCGREERSRLGPQLYYEMRYESLVTHPASECERLCDFLGLPFDEAMVRFYESGRKAPSDAGKDHPWMPITPGLRNWTTQMVPEDVERFEAAAGGLLDELGYPRAVPHPRAPLLVHAAQIRELLAGDRKWIKHFGSKGAKAVGEKVLA